ncbi:protein mesh [Aplysia californica]|uniref:Protein mesh n=1 Tax=Aplysia californica TaxID=6500 RepID=A0ABM0K3F2_APLCA|nr:protein mesh [Aplysia californica]
MCSCAGLSHSVIPARVRPASTRCFTRLLLLSLCVLLAQSPRPARSVPVTAFFPFGTATGDNMTERSDDGSSGKINLTVDFPFFGSRNDKIFVNNNGVISFLQELRTYRPENFPLSDATPIIAPYWADVDISKSNGTVWYRETRDPNILSQATREIRGYHSAYKNFRAYWVFVATWEDVGFYGAHKEGLKKRNTFQAVLVLDSTGTLSFVILNYAKIEWTTGSNSQGNPTTGLGGNPAQAGFNAGDNKNYFEIEGARTSDIVNLTQTSNAGIPGKWIFRIDSATIQDSCSRSESGEIFFRPSFSSMLGGGQVVIDGPCFDSSDVIRGRFESGEELCCYVEEDQARCLLPSVFGTGLMNVSLNIGERGWNYSGLFEIKNVMDVKPLVKRHSLERWVTGAKVRVSWSDKLDFMDAARYRIEVLEYRMTGEVPGLLTVFSQESPRSSNGKYEVEVPSDFQGQGVAVVRVTALSSHCGGLGPSIYSDVFPVEFANSTDSEALCSSWLEAESRLPPLNATGHCPCTLRQAEGDTAQFSVDPFCNEESDWLANCRYRSPKASECILPNQEMTSSSRFICCYDKDTGELLNALDGSGGGTEERYSYRTSPSSQMSPSSIPYMSYMSQDVAPYLHCCAFSSNQTLCDQYLQLRRPVGCQGYSTPAAAQAAGDPHIVSLDGLGYTFNGVGEFYLLRVKDTEAVVQVRASPAEDEEGRVQNATVFSAACMCAGNESDVLEIQLDAQEAGGYSVLVNSEPLDLTSSTTSIFSDMSLYINSSSSSNNTELTVVMDTVGVSVLVEVTPDLLNIMVIAGSQLKGQLEGLLGNYDGDSSNDLMGFDGTLLDPSASMRAIHYGFGMTWEVNANDSLFTVMAASVFDNTLEFLADDDAASSTAYTPIFPDEIMQRGLRNDTKEICGENVQCIFDYEVTGKETIAKSTLKFNEKFEARKEELQPVVRCPYVLAIANGNRTLHGTKVGDNVTFECYPGFQLISGEAVIECQSNGEWNGFPPDCVKAPAKKEEDLPLLYVAIGAAAGGFVVLVVIVLLSRAACKRCSHKTKFEAGSEFDHQIELPSIFPISDIPSPVFENPVFMSSLQKLSEKGTFHIPRPTYVDPNIYTEYF